MLSFLARVVDLHRGHREEGHEPWKRKVTYCLFWACLILFKLAFSYVFEVKLAVHGAMQEWHYDVEVYHWPPTSLGFTVLLIVSRALPIAMIFLVDPSIFYCVGASILAFIKGKVVGLGKARNVGQLASRFFECRDGFKAKYVTPFSPCVSPSLERCGRLIVLMLSMQESSFAFLDPSDLTVCLLLIYVYEGCFRMPDRVRMLCSLGAGTPPSRPYAILIW